MVKHIHIGAMEFFIFTLYLIIAMFFLQIASVYMANNAVGKALSFILGS